MTRLRRIWTWFQANPTVAEALLAPSVNAEIANDLFVSRRRSRPTSDACS